MATTDETSSQAVDGSRTLEVVDWTDLGRRMWSFLTGREAAIHYAFEDITVEVPLATPGRAPRARPGRWTAARRSPRRQR